MIPFGPIGRAAADHIANPQRLRSSGSGARDARGVISFLAIPIVVFWVMTLAWQNAFGGVACWMVFLGTTAALWWAAFRTHGWIGLLTGAGFAVLAAYAMANGLLSNSGLAAQVLGGAVAFIFVGGDQIAVKQGRSSKASSQS